MVDSGREHGTSLALRASSLAPAPIGVFGGTFDPIHHGHLRLAEELADRLGLAQVRMIPARIPPHRAAPRVTSTHRLEMTRLACAANPRFLVDDRECRRKGASYTVDTLRALRSEIGDGVPLCLLMGVDAYLALMTWSRWTQLYALAHVVIAHRPGYAFDPADMPKGLGQETAARLAQTPQHLLASPSGAVLALDTPALEISATAIRAGLQAGHSVRYLLPDSVLDYIARNHLYKELDAG